MRRISALRAATFAVMVSAIATPAFAGAPVPSPEVGAGLGGMALVIPTVVITLSATTYRPGNEDSTPADAAPADASAGGAVKVTPTTESTTTGSPVGSSLRMPSVGKTTSRVHPV